MYFKNRLLVLFLFAFAAPSYAADIIVTVKTPDGKPISNAVVSIESSAKSVAPKVGSFELSQHDLTFDPFVLAIPVGSTVLFPNRDKVRHHVYSFSTAKKFELKLYSKEQSRSILFDKAGLIAIGCNIHDSMKAFIRVLSTPFFSKTGANGTVMLHGVPNGAAVVKVWQPYLKISDNEFVRKLTISGDNTLAFVGSLRKPAPSSGDY
jgi:plastocyanin